MSKPFTYCTRCVDCGEDDIPALDAMTSGARGITWEQFRRHVTTAELRPLFPGYAWGAGTPGLRMSKDYAVSFHRSRWYGNPCLYVRWSAIEFIFIPLRPYVIRRRRLA